MCERIQPDSTPTTESNAFFFIPFRSQVQKRGSACCPPSPARLHAPQAIPAPTTQFTRKHVCPIFHAKRRADADRNL